MLVKEFYPLFKEQLKKKYSQREISTIWWILLSEFLKTDKKNILTHYSHLFLNNNTLKKLNNSISQLLLDIPIAYIIKKWWFSDLPLFINKHVLIPRPETEELVNLALKQTNKPALIADLCSGSGCIALSVSKYYKNAKIVGIEKSYQANIVARKNNRTLKTNVEFITLDIFSDKILSVFDKNKVDLIISNPPYIPFSETKETGGSVIKHEPHQALFVKNKEPLIFYKRISEIAKKILEPKGLIFLEINPNYSKEIKKLFKKAEIIKDINQKERIIKAEI